MNRKTKLLLSIAVLLFVVLSLFDTAWATPGAQGTIPPRGLQFWPTDEVYLSFVVYDSWVPPWWVPHPMSVILRSE